MAAKELIYTLKVEGLSNAATEIGKLDSELIALGKTIKKEREVLATIGSGNEKNSAAYKELSQSIGANITKQRELSKAKSDAIRLAVNEEKIIKAQAGSINQLKAELSNATQQYNALSKVERENVNIGGAIQKSIKATSDELKKLESALGNNTRNVGNYKEALGTLEVSLKQLIAAQAAARKSGETNNAVFVANEAAIQALAEEYQTLAQSEKEVDDQLKALTATENTAGESADSLKSKLGALKEAATLAGEGTEDFKRLTAEAAKLQGQIDATNEAIKSEKGTAFQQFSEQLGGVGQSLGNLDFKQANERIAQLGGTLKGLNFASLKEGVKGATSSFSAFGKVLLTNPVFLVAAAVAAIGIALFALKDKVKIVGQAFEAVTAPINTAIQGFKNLTDTIGLTSFAADELAAKSAASFKASAENYKKFSDAEIAELERQIKIRQSLGETAEQLELQKLQALEKSLAIQIKLARGEQKNLAETDERYKELESTIAGLAESYKDVQTEIIVFNNTIVAENEKTTDELLKNQKEAATKALDERKKAQELLLKLQQENDLALVENAFERERIVADIEFEANKKSVEGLKITNALKLQLLGEYEKGYIRTLNEISAREEQSIKDAEDQILATSRAIEAQGIGGTGNQAKAPDPRDEAEKERQQKLRDERAAEINTEVERFQALAEVTQQGINTIQQIQQAASEKEIARINKETQARIDAVNASVATEEEKAAAIEKITKEQEAKLQKEREASAKQQRNLALVQIAIDTAKGISSAIAAGAAAGPPPANLIAIATGIAAVLSGIAQATAAIQAAKFEQGGIIPWDGGVIQGNSHANGGVKFSSGGRLMEAEGGELIVNKNIHSRPDFVKSISDMNAATGGKSFFAAGGTVPQFQPNGRNVTTNQIVSVDSGQIADSVLSVLGNLQVVNVATDTSGQVNTIAKIQNIAVV